MSKHYTRKGMPIRAVCLSLGDVKRIVERLVRQVEEEGHRLASEIAVRIEHDDTDREDKLAKLDGDRETACRVTVTIASPDGQELFGYGPEIFDSPNVPEVISSIFISNKAAFENATGRAPTNWFSLNLDFSKPPLIDANNPVSSPTPNHSFLQVEGDRDAWVSAIQDSVMSTIRHRENGRGWMHRAFVYDVGVWFFAIPCGIYLCSRLTGIIQEHLAERTAFVSVIVYIYTVIMVLMIYRILFGYAKWAWPTVEIIGGESNSERHRRMWVAITLSLIGAAIYDALS